MSGCPYDANDRLTNRVTPAKGTTVYRYDPVGNVTNVVYPVSPQLVFGYDALNRRTNMVDGVGTTLYSYAIGGQLFTEDGPFASDTMTNGYLNRLRVSLALQQPTGLWTNGFRYDAAHRLTNVTSQAASHDYYLGGTVAGSPLVKKLVFPNGAVITNNFDSVARLLGTYLRTSSGALTNKHEYAYNLAGQRTSTTRADASTVSYTYDKIGQLTVADSSVNSEDRGYFYDAAWNLNRRTNNGTVGMFSVESRNELTAAPIPVSSVYYDWNGNLSASWTEHCEYDDENELISLTVTNVAGSSTLTQFAYDGLMRLRIRQEYKWVGAMEGPSPGDQIQQPLFGAASLPTPSDSWSVTSETHYLYDGNRVIQERDGSNNPLVSYTRGTDLSGSLEGAGGIDGLLARSSGYSSGNWTSHAFYHADGNGNTAYMLNSSQTVLATIS